MGIEGRRALACLILAVSSAVATAQETVPAAVALPDGRLVAGATNTIEVGVLGRLDPPDVSSSSGSARLVREISTGVWHYALPVPSDMTEVNIRVTVDGRPFRWAFSTWTPPEPTIELPRRIDGVARGEPVSFVVTGEDLPEPDALQIVLAEGRVSSVTRVDGGLQVTVVPDDSPFPRYILVGVRDGRRDERPIWGQIRLRARPSLPLESEPGTEVRVSVGSRDYGPLRVDDDGQIEIRIDQYPEELVALARFTDDLGNETRQEIPLTRQGVDQLVSFPSGDLFPGEAPPMLYLAGVRANGFAWSGAPPTCRSAAADLDVLEVSRGRWMVPLPPVGTRDADDLRVDCRLGAEVSERLRVPVVQGIPARIGLRVWPTELRTDFPFAEVRVVLEDHRGERLDVDGLSVSAAHGTVKAQPAGRTQLQGEYDGTEAAARAEDEIRATYTAPAGEGHVGALRVGWDTLPDSGEAVVRAQVVDARRRPLAGEVVDFDAGNGLVSALSGARGVATARVALPDGVAPVAMVARSGARQTQGVGLRGLPGRELRSYDLVESRALSLTPGRVAGLSVRVEPQVLRAAPGAVAFVYVDVEDRVGNLIADEDIKLSVTEGVLGSLRARPDGSLVAEYVPTASERPREVEITAEVDTVRSTTRLAIAPRPVRFTLGAWGGVQSNFGSVLAPVFGLDGDLRVRSRLAGESLMLRFGAARYRFSGEVQTGAGARAVLSSTVYPLTAAVMLRRDMGRFGAWAGPGVVVGLQDLEVRFGKAELGGGLRAVAGPTVVGGAGVRFLGGEALWTAQASWLPTNPNNVGFRGNIGGLATGLGYRLVF